MAFWIARPCLPDSISCSSMVKYMLIFIGKFGIT
jgi:hypothetical protein